MIPPIVIQPPTRFRIYVAMYFGFLCGFCLLVAAAGAATGHAAGLMALAPLGALVALAWRGVRLGAVAQGDGLIVNNWLATRHIPRHAIRSFVIGGCIHQPGKAIRIRLGDGATFPINGSIRPWYLVTAECQAAWESALQAWLQEGRGAQLRVDASG